jgi:Na+/H+ antiporter NhaD/arsenite permease-like protein
MTLEKFKKFIEKETVLVIAFFLAILSCLAIRPSVADLAGYIDFHVLGVLLSLMMVVAGLQKVGVFDFIGIKLLTHVADTRAIVMVLVMLCFFLSMAFTNDVALLTFVPFAIFVLEKAGHPELLVSAIVLQTIAANLGSMLTPVGNPQNLFIYQYYGLELSEFIETVLPYAAVSFVLLVVLVLTSKKEAVRLSETDFTAVNTEWGKAGIYMMLFLVAIASVLGFFHWLAVLMFIVGAIAIIDRDIFPKVDYCLILTFVFFFIFIGNMGSIPLVREILGSLIEGNEVLVGVVASQAISNVPAALLLSEFTANGKDLLVGVNLGGLGTLIASMASLISYKLFAHRYNELKGKYFLWFTVMNLAFLAVLCGLRIIL